MAIKTRVLVVGGKTFHSEPEAKREPVKPPQDQVEKTQPAKRPPPARIEYESPQDYVEINEEPRLASTKNSFILKSNSKFHRDMLDDNN